MERYSLLYSVSLASADLKPKEKHGLLHPCSKVGRISASEPSGVLLSTSSSPVSLCLLLCESLFAFDLLLGSLFGLDEVSLDFEVAGGTLVEGEVTVVLALVVASKASGDVRGAAVSRVVTVCDS